MQTTPAARTLDVEDLTVRYGQAVAVDGVTLAIEPGEVVALLGPSGCGKTTLLRVIAGFVRQAAGRVRVDGTAIDHLPANPVHRVERTRRVLEDHRNAPASDSIERSRLQGPQVLPIEQTTWMAEQPRSYRRYFRRIFTGVFLRIFRRIFHNSRFFRRYFRQVFRNRHTSSLLVPATTTRISKVR